MNRPHLSKFVLSIVSLWLASVLVSQAQTACNNTCESLPPCMMDDHNTCDVTVDSNGSASSVCVTLSDKTTYIKWQTTGGCAINFNTNAGSPVSSTATVCGMAYRIVVQGSPGEHCYGYSITNVVNSPPRSDGDPVVVVRCNGTTTNCATGSAEKRKK